MPRDLKAELKNLSENPSITKLMELAEEAIERAIAAEESVVYLKDQLRKYREMLNDSQCKTDMYKNELQVMTTCRDHWKTSYEENKDRLAAYVEENDIQRASIQQMSAQVVEMRTYIDDIIPMIKSASCKYCMDDDADRTAHCCDWNTVYEECDKLLSKLDNSL